MSEVPEHLFREYGLYLDKITKEESLDTSKDSILKYLVDVKKIAHNYAKK